MSLGLAILFLALLAGASTAWGCCGQGPIVGPRPATPLMEREPAGGPVEVLVLAPLDGAGAWPASLRSALAMLPGVGRVEVDPARGLARVGFRERQVPVEALVESARLAGVLARPTRLVRIPLPNGGEKGRAAAVEAMLMREASVREFELEVEGAAAVARVWAESEAGLGGLIDRVTRVQPGPAPVR
ncbi:MAG: hypothetical protein HYY25_08895 [Candidatus Wallbacteria bacterium]|nr:hypothetical protein [Candidatus Wallbacteria bacterium]